MAATKIITNTFNHIVITDSSGDDASLALPKSGCTIVRRTDSSSVEWVRLNWTAGTGGKQRNWHEIKYDQVVSPTVANNTALEALLKSFAGTPTYLITGTGLHVVDHYAIIGNEDAVLTLVYEDGVARSDLAGKTLKQGIPLFTGLNGAGVFTHIKLTSGSVIICPVGSGGAPWTTSTTSTTTT